MSDHTALIQALSRLAGNRQSDGTSSLVSGADRTAIIDGCYDLIAASKATPSSKGSDSSRDAFVARGETLEVHDSQDSLDVLGLVSPDFDESVTAPDVVEGHPILADRHHDVCKSDVANVDAQVALQDFLHGSDLYSAAERKISEYFVRNYPGPDTIIFDPNWHSPKLFGAAMSALRAATKEARE